MNKILFYLTLALGLFFLSGCEQTTNKYLDITANTEDKIVIENSRCYHQSRIPKLQN